MWFLILCLSLLKSEKQWFTLKDQQQFSHLQLRASPIAVFRCFSLSSLQWHPNRDDGSLNKAVITTHKKLSVTRLGEKMPHSELLGSHKDDFLVVNLYERAYWIGWWLIWNSLLSRLVTAQRKLKCTWTVEVTSENAPVLFTGSKKHRLQIVTTARQRVPTSIAGRALHTLLWASKKSWIGPGENPSISEQPSGGFRPSQCGNQILLRPDCWAR